MTTQAYKVELEGDKIWAQRTTISQDAQRYEGFLHIGIRGDRQTITVLFTNDQDALLFRLKWTK